MTREKPRGGALRGQRIGGSMDETPLRPISPRIPTHQTG